MQVFRAEPRRFPLSRMGRVSRFGASHGFVGRVTVTPISKLSAIRLVSKHPNGQRAIPILCVDEPLEPPFLGDLFSHQRLAHFEGFVKWQQTLPHLRVLAEGRHDHQLEIHLH